MSDDFSLSVLMTVYNEADFIEYAIQSCLPYVDHLVIVEGAYQETIKLGASPRSTDKTKEIIQSFNDSKIHFIEANEQSDTQQRNLGLAKIKELNPNGWMLIIDGDEVYDHAALKMVRTCASTMNKQKKLAAYFKSLTFVNDLRHYAEQEFPRLFKITPGLKFVNDNFTVWEDLGISWFSPYVMRIPYVRYFHYSFCKGKARFELKKKWWETRFGKPFDYGWKVNDVGFIEDENHDIYEYTGTHPSIMVNHPLYKMAYGNPQSV